MHVITSPHSRKSASRAGSVTAAGGSEASQHHAGPAEPLDATARRAVLLSPMLLLLSMFGVFQLATIWLGKPLGHVAGFLLYWSIFGLAVPLLIVGRRGVLMVWGQRAWPTATSVRLALILLAVPPAIAFLFVFPMLFPATTERMLILMAIYAVVNGSLEETFWRGLFARAFPRDVIRGVLYPAVMFALWQLIPMSLYSYWPPVEPQWVAGTALALGLLYGWVAWRTQSIRWTVLSHVLTNLAGVGAFFIFRPDA
jgi:CAAX protease family protein